MTLLYIDTNVWMDFFENRDESAYKLLLRALKGEFKIIVSDTVTRELEKHAVPYKLFFTVLQDKGVLRIEHATHQDFTVAKNLPTHYEDAIHAAIALRTKSTLVTKNVKDFINIPQLTVRRPDTI